MSEEERWGVGKLSIKSGGMWPENALSDLNNAAGLIMEYGFDVDPVDLGASTTIMHSLNERVPDTELSWRAFFEKNKLAYCYVIDGLPKRSALVTSSKWEKSFLSIRRPTVIMVEITDIDRQFREVSCAYMAGMKTLYNGVTELKTGINPEELKGVDLGVER